MPYLTWRLKLEPRACSSCKVRHVTPAASAWRRNVTLRAVTETKTMDQIQSANCYLYFNCEEANNNSKKKLKSIENILGIQKQCSLFRCITLTFLSFGQFVHIFPSSLTPSNNIETARSKERVLLPSSTTEHNGTKSQRFQTYNISYV